MSKSGDYVLAFKGNQTSLHDDAKLFFAGPAYAVPWVWRERITTGRFTWALD